MKQQLPLLTNDIYKKIIAAVNNKDWSGALRLVEEMEQDGEAKWVILDYIFYNISDYTEIEKNILKIGSAYLFYFLGFLYNNQRRFTEAENYYLMAIEKNYKDAMPKLALLYNIQQRFEEAEKYYLMAIEMGDYNSLLTLSSIFYNRNKNKLGAKKLITEYIIKNKKDQKGRALNIAINLWNGEIKDAISHFEEFLKHNSLNDSGHLELASSILLEFLFHHQINFVFCLFTENEFGKELTDHFKPIYYATSILIQKDKNIALIIPPEIKETVNNILKEIKERQIFYYSK